VAKKYRIVHQSDVVIAPRAIATPGTPAGGPPVIDIPIVPIKPDPPITVGLLDSSVEPCLMPVTIGTLDATTQVITPYDPAVCNTLLELHVVYFPSGVPVPTDANAALSTTLPPTSPTNPAGWLDVSASRGEAVKISVPGLPEGPGIIVVIGAFDA
jgi:hypothetical protein